MASPAKLTYTIRVTTSKKKFSGTDDDVNIQMTGINHETGLIHLDNAWHDDFERGSTDSFEIKSVNLGEDRVSQVFHYSTIVNLKFVSPERL